MSRGESAQARRRPGLPAPGSAPVGRGGRLTGGRLWPYTPREQSPAHWRRAFAVILPCAARRPKYPAAAPRRSRIERN